MNVINIIGSLGLNPQVVVTAAAGSTLTCGIQSYTLGSDETTHACIVSFGTYSVSDGVSTQSVTVDAVAQFSVEF